MRGLDLMCDGEYFEVRRARDGVHVDMLGPVEGIDKTAFPAHPEAVTDSSLRWREVLLLAECL